jgi:hypothetical protein
MNFFREPQIPNNPKRSLLCKLIYIIKVYQLIYQLK